MKESKGTDLLIIPLELFQDVLARIRIVDQGISLRTVNELEVPRSWLAEYRLWRHFLVAEREGFYTDPDLACLRSVHANLSAGHGTVRVLLESHRSIATQQNVFDYTPIL